MNTVRVDNRSIDFNFVHVADWYPLFVFRQRADTEQRATDCRMFKTASITWFFFSLSTFAAAAAAAGARKGCKLYCFCSRAVPKYSLVRYVLCSSALFIYTLAFSVPSIECLGDNVFGSSASPLHGPGKAYTSLESRRGGGGGHAPNRCSYVSVRLG